jgi:hypothetical protein
MIDHPHARSFWIVQATAGGQEPRAFATREEACRYARAYYGTAVHVSEFREVDEEHRAGESKVKVSTPTV